MKTLVLGAGASAHAGYPLASTLGSRLREWAGTDPANPRREAMAQLVDIYGSLDNFESVLTDLLISQPGLAAAKLPRYAIGNLQSNVEEAIREYFDTIRHQPALLYDQLCSEHLRQGDTVITFNYDLAIERSLRAAGLWNLEDGYGFQIVEQTEPSPISVLKLHGSTNWRALLFGGLLGFGAAYESLGQRPVLFFRPDLEYLGYPAFVDPRCTGLDTAASLAAMILPNLQKRFYYETSFGREWEPFWTRLWNRAEQALLRSEEIVIIGYSLPVADADARKLLLETANKRASLSVCCGTQTASIEEQYRRVGFTNIQRIAECTFDGWLSAKRNPSGVN